MVSSYRTDVITTRTRSERSKGGFATFGLSSNLLRAIADIGFSEPRPIQAKAIPQALTGRDILGLAQTGTGKTAAFALPMLELLSQTKGHNPRALIVSPTRELALQIHAEIELLGKYTNLRALPIFGGVGIAPQVRALKKSPDILVACPGRLLDLMGSGSVRLDGIEILVLDEADHMLDMGFLPDIKRILAKLPERRQNLLFSATMPKEIRGLTERVLRNPHVVELSHSSPAETIEHALYAVDQSKKSALLQKLLAADDFRSAIVFLRTKHRARRLAQELEKAGHNAIALQGNMSQAQRQRAMQGFREGRYDVLVATDIAARGIDVAQISHVINFDVPNTPDAYTHRIGRTGRAERSGKAFTFMTREDAEAVRAIERKLGTKIPRITTEDTDELEDSVSLGRPMRQRSQGSGRTSKPSSKFSKSTGIQAGKGRSRSGKASASRTSNSRTSNSRASNSQAPSGKPALDKPSPGKAPARTAQFGAGIAGSAASQAKPKSATVRQRTRRPGAER